MDIVINCLGMPFNGETLKDRSLGGSESACFYMSRELVKLGHCVTVFTREKGQTLTDEVRYIWAGDQSEDYPNGQQFHFYAENTPHDILIIQRSPHAFLNNYASKINLLWMHDLATYSQKDANTYQLWNIDGVLVVSEYHKKQVSEVYGIDEKSIHVIRNGVDLDLYSSPIENELKKESKTLLYSSRPERGLEHLLAPGGIMEQLKDDDINLLYCSYDNPVGHMQEYYDYLNGRAEQLDNVQNIGSLNKKELSDLQRQVDLCVYPTPSPISPDFREVSCITVMECVAANLPMVTSAHGAIPETGKGAGLYMADLADGKVDVPLFVETIKRALKNPNQMKAKMKKARPRYSWLKSAKTLNDLFETKMLAKSDNALMQHFLDVSDMPSFNAVLQSSKADNPIQDNLVSEFDECYDFYRTGNLSEHYKSYYQYEKGRGVDYGDEQLEGVPRFEQVAGNVDKLDDGAIVIDYGCAHGAFSMNLAVRYPNKKFIGIDIAQSNIDSCRKLAEEKGLDNVEFYCGHIQGSVLDINLPKADCILVCEVLEHVVDYRSFMKGICNLGKVGAQIVITTPYGPWESIGYEEHWPWRAHLHHFDRHDIKEIFADFPNLEVYVIPGGQHKGEVLGSYVYTFNTIEDFDIKKIRYGRKIAHTMPRQTVSLCMIVENCEATIQQSIESVIDVVNEVIVCIDSKSKDGTEDVLNRLDAKYKRVAFHWEYIDSPLIQGFDSARNMSIAKASGDWILWLDDDEKVVKCENILKYLRNNEFNGYGIAQHHYAVEPLGVMKTDFPIRLFRNNIGVRFYGMVHEHPEIKMNDQMGRAHIVDDVQITHNGYETEEIRRGRFSRNIDLMRKDREKYPTRTLSKYLWIRDLAQLTKYEMEQNNCSMKTRIERSDEANILWRELVEKSEIRMACDSMDFYSYLNSACNRGVKATFKCDFDKNGDPTLADKREIGGRFRNKEHVSLLFNTIMESKTRLFDSPDY